MISVANINNQWYFLDGTAPNAKLDFPPHHIQGKQALMAIDQREFKVLTVPVALAESNRVIDSTFIRVTPTGISGSQKIIYEGYPAADIWDDLLYKNDRNRQDFVKSKLARGSNKFMLGKYLIEDKKDAGFACIRADFELPGYGKMVGDEYYINLNIGKLFDNQLIDTAKRKVPKSFEYIAIFEQNHILEIPEGFRVSYKPDDLLVDNPFYKVEIKYSSSPGKLVATQRVTSKSILINPGDFVTWNKDLAVIQMHYKEQIVLEKFKK
jgi:hypothetical protein